MGKYFEEIEAGDRFVHATRKTITEAEHILFCGMTLNTQPLHIDESFAAESIFGHRIVNGLFTLGLAVGMTVPELTSGTIIANLGYESIRHPNPVFHGDTLHVETEIIEKRPSRSNPDRGIVKMRHIGRNQENVMVIEIERTVLMLRIPSQKQDAE